MSNTPIFLKLAMGTAEKIETSNFEFGKISYASDSHILYIDSKNTETGKDERQHVDARYATGLKDATGKNFVKINLDNIDGNNTLSFLLNNNILNLKVNNLAADSITVNSGQVSQGKGSFDTLHTKKIVIGKESDNITIESEVVVKESEEDIKNIIFSADNIYINNNQLITKEAVESNYATRKEIESYNYATKEEVEQIASQIKPDTSMTAIWHCGDVPPDDTKLLWIRTGVGFGNGILYYYNPPVLDYENDNETIEIYFNDSTSKIIKYGQSSFENGILKFKQEDEINITDDTTQDEFSKIDKKRHDIKILLDEKITNNNDILKEQDIRRISFEGCILDNNKIIGISIKSFVMPDASEPNNWTPMSAIYT